MLLVSSGTFASRILGLARDVVLAHVWGTGAAMGAFVFAFTIPNLFRALFGEGAFNAAFVPVFSERLEKDGKGRAWDAACTIISSLACVLAGVVVAGVAVSMALGTVPRGTRFDLALRLLPWLMPYTLLICLSHAFGGVLNGLRRFAIPAYSPGLLNAFLIAGALWLAPRLGDTPEEQVFALAFAVLAAGCAQLLLHVVRCSQLGCVLRFQPSFQSADTRKVMALLGPVVIGAGVVQLNTLVDRVLAKLLGDAAITSLYYSQRLVYLPVGLFGVALGVVCLPAMSRAWARGDVDGMRSSLSTALRQVFFLTVPVVAAFWALREPVVRLFFERGSFDSRSTAETVWALLFYLPGIPAFAAVKVAVTPFHARQDTRTPLRIAVVCMVLNVILNLVLMLFLRQGGLALATSICSWLNLYLLMRITKRNLEALPVRSLVGSVGRLLLAGLLAAGAGHVVVAATASALPASWSRVVASLSVVALGGLTCGVTYAAGCALLRCRELGELLGGIRRRG